MKYLMLASLILVCMVSLSDCKTDNSSTGYPTVENTTTKVDTTVIETATEYSQKSKDIATQILDYDTSQWTEITSTANIILDLKYATTDNFTKRQIYDCPRCFLKPHVADSLYTLVEYLKAEYNYSVILYDCYRPRPYQQKLWDIVQDKRYVTPPEKGSMHNRGMAIDLALADSTGILLDMGTAFDHFGQSSFHSATDISQEAIDNRKVLKTAAARYGFLPITSEWWHYSYRKDIKALDNWLWPCPEE